ncbi:MAG: quinol:cytochrome C oxidoreductase, partial [Planctomycetota bacterium]
MAHGHHIDASEDLAKTFEETGGWLLLPAAGVGVIGLVTAAFLGMSAGWERLAFSYLTAFCYFFSIAAAATIFLMISHVCRAAWLTTVRRLAEYMSAGMWVYGLLFVPLLIVVASESGMVFPWTSQAYVDAHTLVQAKTWWLDVNQFLFRNVLYFAIFALLGRSMLKKSAAMDVEGADAVALAKKLEKNSAWGIPLAALTLTAGAIDWIMTLAPEWYSTIIGVYLFAGGAMGFFAVMSFLAIVLTQSGTLSKAITVEHRHDLGKLAFAFVVFWSYIAFSQYLLIWYADIPEETVWYRVRQMNGWQYVG